MTAKLSTGAVRSTVAIAACTAAVLALSSTRIASTQTSGTNQQISVLQQQLSALDRRVKTLEEAASAAAAADQVKQEPANGGKPDAATLDSRIAQLEAEVRSLQSQEATETGGGGSQATKAQGGRPQALQSLTVKLPFKIVDTGNHTLLILATDGGEPILGIGNPDSGGHATIGVSPNGSPRIVFTNKAGKSALVIGENAKGGNSVALFGADSGQVETSMGTDPKGGYVRVYPNGGGSAQAELVAASDTGGGAVNVYDLQGEAVGWLEASKTGNGRFTIGRAGKIYVEAGALESGRGFVIAGPDVGGAPPGLVIPYYLEGRLPH